MIRVLFLLIYFLFIPSHVLALESPSFPSCAAPSGQLIVSYSQGTHGIVGDTSVYTGRDQVYKLDNDNYLQCFCSVDGRGIQTNWWKDGSLSQDQINVLRSQGWVYVPNGDLWGLEARPYVAQNSQYSCLATTPSPSSNPNSSSSDGIGGGDDGEVLGLAATGNSLTLLAIFVLSLLSLVAGIRKLRG